MTLTLVDPSTAAVVQHPGGVISVRCADYVGAARGTLSTVSDALAAAGTAVKEEQTIAVPTSLIGTGPIDVAASLDDSVTIPLADLNRTPDTRYWVFVSTRMEGAPPTNALKGASWAAYDGRVAGVGVGMVMSEFGTVSESVGWIPNHLSPAYGLRDFGGAVIFEDDTDDFFIRAWGVTGGDVAVYLETVYFIPIFLGFDPGEDRSWQFQPAEFIPALFQNGEVWRDEDNSTADLPDMFGKFSVLPWSMPPWTPGGEDWGQVVDFQEADNEPTAADACGFEILTDDPRGFLIIPVGATLMEADTLLTDDFSVTQVVDPTYGAHYTAKAGKYTRLMGLGANGRVLGYWDSPSYGGTNSRKGMFVEAASGVATTYIGDTSTTPSTDGDLISNGNHGSWAHCAYGYHVWEGGFLANEDSSDPRNYEPQFAPHLECLIAECRTSLIDSLGECATVLGMAHTTGWTGARLGWTAGGDVELSLDTSYGSLEANQSSWKRFASEVAVASGYSLGDYVWIKVEKRAYSWRAKAWMDGDSEPDWMVEGFQPLRKLTTGTGWIDYPYDDNWDGVSTNDTWDLEPRGGLRGIADNLGSPAFRCEADTHQTRFRILVDDFEVAWNPGSGTPGDINLHLESYDGGTDYGTVTIPWGAHRIVVADRANYISDADTHGFNVRVWKEPGSPALMTAGLGLIFMQIPGGAFVPFVYRRVVSG